MIQNKQTDFKSKFLIISNIMTMLGVVFTNNHIQGDIDRLHVSINRRIIHYYFTF